MRPAMPSDIPYPVDLRLLDEAQATTEKVIDGTPSEGGMARHEPRSR